MEFEEQAAGIAENRTDFVSSPERSGRGGAVLAGRLCGFPVVSCHCRHVVDVGGLGKFDSDKRRLCEIEIFDGATAAWAEQVRSDSDDRGTFKK